VRAMVLRFYNETPRTTLLPPTDLQCANNVKAAAAEKLAVSAANRRSAAVRSGPCTLVEVEELIGQLVRLGAADGYHELVPGSGLFYHCGSSSRHMSMLSSSYPMLSRASATQGGSTTIAGAALPDTHLTEAVGVGMSEQEGWRRFLGQQLMLLTELMVFAVPAFFADSAAVFDPSAKRKRYGALRSELSLHGAYFVQTKAKADTAAVRSMAVAFARTARVCDIVYGSNDCALFADVIGLQLPAAHDLITIFMLRYYTLLLMHSQSEYSKSLQNCSCMCLTCREPTLTPTASLLSFTTNVIMQIQAAGALGRVPCAASVLVHVTHAEMEKFRLATGIVVESTPCLSIAELASGVASAAAAPPVTVAFIKAAAARGDKLLPYYGVQRLARELYKPGEELAATTQNGLTCHFRTLLNAFRAQCHPAGDPAFHVLFRLHKPYQVSWTVLSPWPFPNQPL
jgi:hypothetical protein